MKIGEIVKDLLTYDQDMDMIVIDPNGVENENITIEKIEDDFGNEFCAIQLYD